MSDDMHDEFGRAFYFSEHLDGGGNSEEIDQGDEPQPCTRDKANLLSSKCRDNSHMPVLDIDFPVRLIESSTKGHFHLYIDVKMTWTQQCVLMAAMENAGIMQPGFRHFSERRGMSFCRPEWVKKPKEETLETQNDECAF